MIKNAIAKPGNAMVKETLPLKFAVVQRVG
jgi:hypothetical protein